MKRRVACEWCGYAVERLRRIAFVIDGQLDAGGMADLCPDCVERVRDALLQAREGGSSE